MPVQVVAGECVADGLLSVAFEELLGGFFHDAKLLLDLRHKNWLPHLFYVDFPLLEGKVLLELPRELLPTQFRHLVQDQEKVLLGLLHGLVFDQSLLQLHR